MLYFSVSTQTSTGLGQVTPLALYADGIVCIQMLLTVLYNTTILAKGLSSFGGLAVRSPDDLLGTTAGNDKTRTRTFV